MYCIEYLVANLDWLDARLDALPGSYLIFDCPGQAELFTHHGGFAAIVAHLQKRDVRLASVHLVDAHQCTDGSKFISAALLSLTSMIRLEAPAVNILSKVDTLPGYGELRESGGGEGRGGACARP